MLSGIANISGGDITFAYNLKTYENSLIEVTGGLLNFDSLDMHGTLNLRGGTFYVNRTYASSDATVNIYGYGFNYDPSGGTASGGILTGYLLDNSPFTFDNLNEYGYSQFNLIPEPATMFLMGIGGLFLRRNCRK